MTIAELAFSIKQQCMTELASRDMLPHMEGVFRDHGQFDFRIEQLAEIGMPTHDAVLTALSSICWDAAHNAEKRRERSAAADATSRLVDHVRAVKQEQGGYPKGGDRIEMLFVVADGFTLPSDLITEENLPEALSQLVGGSLESDFQRNPHTVVSEALSTFVMDVDSIGQQQWWFVQQRYGVSDGLTIERIGEPLFVAFDDDGVGQQPAMGAIPSIVSQFVGFDVEPSTKLTDEELQATARIVAEGIVDAVPNSPETLEMVMGQLREWMEES